MNKTLPLAAALALGITSAHAADKPKPTVWNTYSFSEQVCKQIPGQLATPVGTMAYIRQTYHVEPETEDVTDDAGKVTSVIISFYMAKDDNTASIRMFRAKADCEAYAADQRTDTKKYE